MMSKILSLVTALFAVTQIIAQSASYFINEISYIASNPTSVVYEIAGPASDLTGWSVAGYDSDGWLSTVEDLSNQVIPNQQNGYGTVWYDIDQAGDGGGLALIDASGTVQQFVAFGSIQGAALLDGALDGPAAGEAPDFIGQVGLLGNSLQLVGVGTLYPSFFWLSSQVASIGQVNDNQLFILGLLGLQSNESSTAASTKAVVWPNPTHDQIRLNVPALEQASERILSLYDQNGRQLVRRNISADAQTIELPASQYPAGIYYLTLYSQDNFWQSEVVLQ